jgi:hypothetical protein
MVPREGERLKGKECVGTGVSGPKEEPRAAP